MEKDFEIRKLEARVKNLEKQIEFLLKINGLDLSALRNAPNEELLKYYRDAVLLLGMQESQLAPEIIAVWADLFCQLSEYELVRLQELVHYDHTWEPFYHLCIRMMTAVRHRKKFATDTTLKNLYMVLEKARKNLRAAAVIMVQKYPQSLPAKAKALMMEELPL